jgi:hypothetical protein
MTQLSPRTSSRRRRWRVSLALGLGVLTGGSLLAATGVSASASQSSGAILAPGNLLVSGSDYTADPGILSPGATVLPPGCTSDCAVATDDGSYPQVFNNVLADPAFGVTSPVFLDQVTPSGQLVSTINVPDGTTAPDGHSGDFLTTSFSSKSELALNQSTNGQYVTFMGYLATPGTVDVSNANTPGVNDPTNPVTGSYYRVVAQLDAQGRFRMTETNAYSGDNGRAAILNNSGGANVLYLAGNAGNGSSPQPAGIIESTGAQIATPAGQPEQAQQPGAPAPVGSFSVTQLGDKADKTGKDTNFRGMTIYDNVLYYTKDSGSNGINSVYFVDTTGTACPNGVGLPVAGASLPLAAIAYNPATVASVGVQPYNMCILQGFPTTLAKTSTWFPADLWFANPHTIYVADEGNGTSTYDATSGTYTAAAAQTTAGLQKWVFNGTSWQLAYTLTSGLNLGQPYATPAGYPAGINAATGLPWAPAVDGLRNITGRVNADGTVTIYAITATVSGNGDQGADPNQLVAITDNPAATTLPAGEGFQVLQSAGFGQVLRGVSFTPGTPPANG